jgi:hypothetical protein
MWNPQRWGMYSEAMREVAPIAFYGKVVDETALPIEGAQVTLRVSKRNWAYILGVGDLIKYQQMTLVTDENGEFQITGASGRALEIVAVEKEGYEFKPRIVGGGNWDTGFFYAGGGVGKDGPHKPDPKRPIVFDMVRQ